MCRGRRSRRGGSSACFQATRDGELFLKVWVELDGNGAAIVKNRLERDGVENVDDAFSRVLLRYGVRRLEAVIEDLLVRGAGPDIVADKWQVTEVLEDGARVFYVKAPVGVSDGRPHPYRVVHNPMTEVGSTRH
jgi:hypothetical protein